MAFEKEDLIDREFEEVDIDGRKFKIRIMTGEESDRMANKFVTITDDETIDIDIVKKNEQFFINGVIDAPYEYKGKPFKDLDLKDKLELFQKKLKPMIRGKILKKIAEVNGLQAELLKK